MSIVTSILFRKIGMIDFHRTNCFWFPQKSINWKSNFSFMAPWWLLSKWVEFPYPCSPLIVIRGSMTCTSEIRTVFFSAWLDRIFAHCPIPAWPKNLLISSNAKRNLPAPPLPSHLKPHSSGIIIFNSSSSHHWGSQSTPQGLEVLRMIKSVCEHLHANSKVFHSRNSLRFFGLITSCLMSSIGK